MYNGEVLNSASNPNSVIIFDHNTPCFITSAIAPNPASVVDMPVSV